MAGSGPGTLGDLSLFRIGRSLPVGDLPKSECFNLPLSTKPHNVGKLDMLLPKRKFRMDCRNLPLTMPLTTYNSVVVHDETVHETSEFSEIWGPFR